MFFQLERLFNCSQDSFITENKSFDFFLPTNYWSEFARENPALGRCKYIIVPLLYNRERKHWYIKIHFASLLFLLLPPKCGHASLRHVAHINFRGHTSNSLPPTQCTRKRFLLAWYPHNLRGISTENAMHLVYFRHLVHFQLFSFNEGPTFPASSTDVKGLFKSISNTLARLSVRVTVFISFLSLLPKQVKCEFTQPLHHGQDMTRCQFLSGVKLAWIQSLFFYLPYQGNRTQSVLLLTHRWRENRCFS